MSDLTLIMSCITAGTAAAICTSLWLRKRKPSEGDAKRLTSYLLVLALALAVLAFLVL